MPTFPARLALTCAAAWLTACSTVDRTPYWTDGGGETGPTYGDEPPIEPRGIVSSKVEYDAHYSRIAVGNIARSIDDPGCCSDYVLAGPGADDVRVVFGGGADTGLVFLDDRPDEVLALGPTDDVALVDLNEDGRNDLVALGTDHQLDVRLGASNPGPDGPFLAQSGVSTLVSANLTPTIQLGSGAGDFATGDVDADGHLDIVAAAPEGGIIIRWGRGDGAFDSASGFSGQTEQDFGPVRLVVAPLDDHAGDDVASANADGSFSVWLDATGDRDFNSTQRHVLRPISNTPCETAISCWDNTATAVVVAGSFCVSGPGLDLAYAFQEHVWIMCGVNGQFGNVGEEPHGNGVGPNAAVADYRFDLNGPSQALHGVIDDAFVIDDDIYVLRQPEAVSAQTFINHAHRVVQLVVDHDTLDQGKGTPVLELYTSTQRIVQHPASVGSDAMRLAWPELGLARWRLP